MQQSIKKKEEKIENGFYRYLEKAYDDGVSREIRFEKKYDYMCRKLLYGKTVNDFTVKVGVSRESVLKFDFVFAYNEMS